MGLDPGSLLALTHGLALADAAWRRRCAELLRVTDMDLGVLLDLMRAGHTTHDALVAALDLSAGGAEALVQRLEGQGLLRREHDIERPRHGRLVLSPAATLELGAVTAPAVERLEGLASVLLPHERSVLARQLKALTVALAPPIAF